MSASASSKKPPPLPLPLPQKQRRRMTIPLSDRRAYKKGDDEWIPDSQAKSCHKCHQKFTRLLRKHHCRSCGKVFCGKCSSRRSDMKLDHLNMGTVSMARVRVRVRVCDACFGFTKIKTGHLDAWTGKSWKTFLFELQQDPQAKTIALSHSTKVQVNITDETEVTMPAAATAEFTVRQGKREIKLRTESDLQREEWVQAIEDAKQVNHTQSKQNKINSTAAEKATEGGKMPRCTGLTKAGLKRQSSKLCQRLEEIAVRDENMMLESWGQYLTACWEGSPGLMRPDASEAAKKQRELLWQNQGEIQVYRMDFRRRRKLFQQHPVSAMEFALEGQRVVLLDVYAPEPRHGTVMHLDSNRTSYTIRIDNSAEMVSCGLHAGNHILMEPFEYKANELLSVFHEGQWQDAIVKECCGRKQGSRHLVAIGESEHILDLNHANHCPSTLTTAQYLLERTQYMQDMEGEFTEVDDALTGQRLKTKEQLIEINIQESIRKTAGRPIPLMSAWSNEESVKCIGNVTDLTNMMKHAMQRTHERPQGTTHARSVVIVAGPGTGKTWTTKQLMYMLLNETSEKEEKEHTAQQKVLTNDYVPFLLPVQKLAYHLRRHGRKETAVRCFGRDQHLLETYIQEESALQPYKELLLSAFRSRRLILIIDGIDEAADLKSRIEDFIHNVLVPEAHPLIITSRPEGIHEELYEQTFLRLTLKELSTEQQERVIKQQMDVGPGREFFDNLFRFVECRTSFDALAAELCPENKIGKEIKSFDKTIKKINGTKVYEDEYRQVNKIGDVVTNIDEFYEVAREAKPIYDKILEEFMASCGLSSDQLVKVSNKLKETAEEKAENKYPLKKGIRSGPCFAWLIDVVRASIMCKNEDEILSVVRHLETHSTLKMIRLKNYFSKKNLDPAHFRRLGITLMLPLPSLDIVHYVELQVHINAIFEFKKNNSHPQPPYNNEHLKKCDCEKGDPKCRDLNTGPYHYFRDLFHRDAKVMDQTLNHGWMQIMEERLQLFNAFLKVPVLLSLFVRVLDQMPQHDGKVKFRMKDLPSSKAALYSQAITGVVRTQCLDGDEMAMLNVLKKIALHNHTHKRRQFNSQHVVEALEDNADLMALANYHKVNRKQQHQDQILPLFKMLEESEGEFGVAQGKYQGMHLSFQEYLCAAALKDVVDEAGNLDDDMRGKVLDDAYYENMLDFAGDLGIADAIFPKTLTIKNMQNRTFRLMAGFEHESNALEELVASNMEPQPTIKDLGMLMGTGFTKLSSLNLAGNALHKGDGATEFWRKLLTHKKFLTTLNLKGNFLGDDGTMSVVKAIIGSKSLTILDLSDNEISSGCTNAIAERLASTSLVELNLSGNNASDVSSLAKMLSINCSLVSLNLGGNNIQDVSVLADAMTKNTTLTALDLSRNSIKETIALEDMLASNTSLESLSLRGNPVSRPEDIAVLKVLIARNKLLQNKIVDLDLSGNGILDISPLADALTTNTSVTKLILSENVIEDISSLGEAMAKNTTVTALDLRRNAISDIAALAKMLTVSGSLVSLNLGHNQIKEVALLADALAKNTFVTALDLSRNAITDIGALARMLTHNSSLVSVNLGCNQIKEVAALADAVSQNQSLVTLILASNPRFSDSDKVVLETAWQRGNNGRALGTTEEKFALNLIESLYFFDSQTFTSGGVKGRGGPDLVKLLESTEYGGGGSWEREESRLRADKAWLRNPAFFCAVAIAAGEGTDFVTTPLLPPGYQRMTVPCTGWYLIEAAGASSTPQKRKPDEKSGRYSHRYFGLGAVVAGEFWLQRGAALLMVVGQQPPDSEYHGGSGGSFVCLGDDVGSCEPLIIAGGAGSHDCYDDSGLSVATLSAEGCDGTAATESAGHDTAEGKGGTHGQEGDGRDDPSCGSGAGFTGDGSKHDHHYVKHGACSFRNGATGGRFDDGDGKQDGGFGGGGYGGWTGSGGGGGYNGGAARVKGSSGGGGSFNIGARGWTQWGGGGGVEGTYEEALEVMRRCLDEGEQGHLGSGRITVTFLGFDAGNAEAMAQRERIAVEKRKMLETLRKAPSPSLRIDADFARRQVTRAKRQSRFSQLSEAGI